MMMYRPTTNITARRTMTLLTIQCAWLNNRGTSRFAASADAAENPGIVGNGDSMRDKPGSNRGARHVAWATRVALATLCLLVHGCDNVLGGAVELSWKLRPESSSLADKFVDCEPTGDVHFGAIDRIQLSWRMSDGP